jgi:hypothetical protein
MRRRDEECAGLQIACPHGLAPRRGQGGMCSTTLSLLNRGGASHSAADAGRNLSSVAEDK